MAGNVPGQGVYRRRSTFIGTTFGRIAGIEAPARAQGGAA